MFLLQQHTNLHKYYTRLQCTTVTPPVIAAKILKVGHQVIYKCVHEVSLLDFISRGLSGSACFVWVEEEIVVIILFFIPM